MNKTEENNRGDLHLFDSQKQIDLFSSVHPRLNHLYFDKACEELAKSLLGKIFVRKLGREILKGKIVETECYLGGIDKASHSYNGRITERNRPMYMKPGTTYVYLTYGMYYCFNISSRGDGAAVLLRALEPITGFDYMNEQRCNKRKKKNVSSDDAEVKKSTKQKELKVQELCNGPAKLCISFGIDKSCNEKDLSEFDSMWCEDDSSETQQELQIVSCPRIGIDSAGIEWASKPLRFYIFGNPFVSKRDKVHEKMLFDM